VQEAEPVEHLCEKCKAYSDDWKPTADKLWGCGHFTKKGYVNFAKPEEKAAM
jgi:hypothetical protein